MYSAVKCSGFKLLAAVLFVFYLLIPIPAVAAVQGEQVLENRPVAEGLLLEKRKVTLGGGDTLVYILKANLTNQYLKINALVGADGTLGKNAGVTDMAVSAGAVAAVNGDFFQMSESGRPIGMTFKDGQLITSPPLRDDMPGWAVTKAGIPMINVFNFKGMVKTARGGQFMLGGINKPSYFEAGEKDSHQNSLLLYNRFWGVTSRGKIGDSDQVTEVFVRNGVVGEVLVNQPGKSIPENGFVLAGRGSGAEFIKSNIKVGDKITVEYSVTPDGDKLWAGTGGWSLLVDSGRALDGFPADINGLAARTAIGYTADKKNIIVATVEKSSQSRGLTLNELAGYMVSLGADRALNLDGGGSTTMAARPLGEDKPVLVNRPQRDAQRNVPTGLGFFTSAPKGNLSGLIIKGPDIILPGDKASFSVSGYDSHYNPFSVDQSGVKWSVASGPGSFDKNVFNSRESGETTVAAEVGSVKKSTQVKLMGAGDFTRLLVEPSPLVLQPGKTADLKVSATGTDGTVYKLTSDNYSVAVDPGLGQFDKGSFKAASKLAIGEMKVSLGSLTVTVPVTVLPEDQTILSYNPGTPGVLTIGDLSVSLTAKALAGPPVVIAASYGGELLGNIPARYKSVATVKLEALGSVAGIKFTEPAAVSWKFQSAGGARMAVLQFIGGAWQELPSRVLDNRLVCRIWELGPIMLVREEQAAARFSDVAGHWAAEAVARLTATGIVSGYPDNKFAPASSITRAEFVTMLSRAMGWQPVQGDISFRDKSAIPGWAAGYILTASDKGVVSGYEDRTFQPTGLVTRAEMAAMITKALSLPAAKGVQLDKAFVDARTVDKWAVNPISSVYNAGIMKGDNEKKFRPKDRATRAESAVLIDNVLTYLFRQ